MKPQPRGFRRAITAAQKQAERAQEDRAAAESFSTEIAGATVRALSKLGYLAGPPTPIGSLPHESRKTLRRLLNEMALPDYNNGFTLSPTFDETGTFVSPGDGQHCVALPSTDVPIPWAVQPERDDAADPVPEEATQQLSDWITFMAPVFSTGIAWIGGFRRPADNAETDDAEIFETEATLVFLPERREQAHESALVWKQRSFWTIIQDHPGGGDLTTTLRPCGSVFVALQRLRGTTT